MSPPRIRIELPQHLRVLAGIQGLETRIQVPVLTLRGTLDALEAAYPMLRGTIRDQFTGERRAFLRFFACQEDLSHLPLDTPLPPLVVGAKEPLIILGAVAGG
jgi:hypothetical protein